MKPSRTPVSRLLAFASVLAAILMAQAGNVVLGRFEQAVRMYKAPPAHALTEEFYETDPHNDFVRAVFASKSSILVS